MRGNLQRRLPRTAGRDGARRLGGGGRPDRTRGPDQDPDPLGRQGIGSGAALRRPDRHHPLGLILGPRFEALVRRGRRLNLPGVLQMTDFSRRHA
ncbi:hypothetical protein KL86PLE_30603 [uncultured Pleomorphomonas sp.]|uniref:Uncharacterized protein n=1 Tax=uncultured Pleomorphomonas sp. TaxID=442121 RepID=A0A212LF00_9HYPH|nr:hypothetical protein KL86PLE_30603 [uncultured Pleomorphomonas sp.]